jgi:hypothetical protein
VLVVPNAPLTSTTGFYALRREAVVDDSSKKLQYEKWYFLVVQIFVLVGVKKVCVAIWAPVIRSGPLLRVAPGLELCGDGRRPLGP